MGPGQPPQPLLPPLLRLQPAVQLSDDAPAERDHVGRTGAADEAHAVDDDAHALVLLLHVQQVFGRP